MRTNFDSAGCEAFFGLALLDNQEVEQIKGRGSSPDAIAERAQELGESMCPALGLCGLKAIAERNRLDNKVDLYVQCETESCGGDNNSLVVHAALGEVIVMADAYGVANHPVEFNLSGLPAAMGGD